MPSLFAVTATVTLLSALLLDSWHLRRQMGALRSELTAERLIRQAGRRRLPVEEPPEPRRKRHLHVVPPLVSVFGAVGGVVRKVRDRPQAAIAVAAAGTGAALVASMVVLPGWRDAGVSSLPDRDVVPGPTVVVTRGPSRMPSRTPGQTPPLPQIVVSPAAPPPSALPEETVTVRGIIPGKVDEHPEEAEGPEDDTEPGPDPTVNQPAPTPTRTRTPRPVPTFTRPNTPHPQPTKTPRPRPTKTIRPPQTPKPDPTQDPPRDPHADCDIILGPICVELPV